MKNKTGIAAVAMIATAAFGTAAQAHSGHGMDGGFLHQLTSPYHIAILLGIAVVAATGAEIVRRRKAKRARG